MKKLLQIVMITTTIGFLSTSFELRPLIGELVEDVLGTAADVASAPFGPYWWDHYWGPYYWDDYGYYPYLIERYPVSAQKIEIAGDNWNITNKTNKEIIVGTYDGKIRGRIRPGETIQIPTRGDNRLIIGHKDTKAKIFSAQPGDVLVTEKSAQEIEINPEK